MNYIIDNEGVEPDLSICNCCGGITHMTHGFVWGQSSPVGVYYVVWGENLHDSKEEKVFFLTVSLGDFIEIDDHADMSNHRTFGIMAQDTGAGYAFGFIEEPPVEAPDLLGRTLSPDEARIQPDVADLWQIVDTVFQQDRNVTGALTLAL